MHQFGFPFPQARRWPLALIAASAGTAALIRDVPATAALLIVPAAAAALAFLLSHPLAWIPIWIALALVAPPFPVTVAGLELPVHPAVAVFAAALLVGWVRLPEWRLERSSLVLAWYAFLGILLASLPLAFFYSGTAVGAQSALRWLLLCQSFVLLAWTAWGPAARAGADGSRSSGNFAALLVKVVLVVALLSAAFAVVDFFYKFPTPVRFSAQYIYMPEGHYRRAQGVFYDASTLGNFCAMVLALIAALDGEARRQLRLPNWLLWLPVPVLAAALLLSFSRASMANLLIALLVLAWLRRNALWRLRPVLRMVMLSAAAALAVILLAPEMALRYGYRVVFTFSQLLDDPNRVFSFRLESWHFLAGFLAENPQHLLLGIGYKSLPYTAYFGRDIVADNMYLSLLVETGLPGLLALLLLCGALLAHAYRLGRHSEAAVAALGCFLFAFWCGQMVQMLSGDTLTYWRVTPVYFAILGAAIRRSRTLAGELPSQR